MKPARRAASDLRVDLSLAGGTAIEGVGFALDGVIVPQFVSVPAGRVKATFTITTSGTAGI